MYTLPQRDPWQIAYSRYLPRRHIELIVASHGDPLDDPQAKVLAVNDGSGWRDPRRQLETGATLRAVLAAIKRPRIVRSEPLRAQDTDGLHYVQAAPALTTWQRELYRELRDAAPPNNRRKETPNV